MRKINIEKEIERDYFVFLRSLRCAACYSEDRTEVHHLRGLDKKKNAVGKKPPYYLTIPLCSVCHKKITAVGGGRSLVFDERQHDWLKWLCGSLESVYVHTEGNRDDGNTAIATFIERWMA